MDRGAWWATVHGVTKSRTQLSDKYFFTCCIVGRIIAFKSAHFLTSRTCECVTVQSKWDFADVVKPRTWRWGDCSRSSGEAQ